MNIDYRGKGNKRQTILLGDPRLVQFRAYLQQMGYKHGPLFRQERWDHYCVQAGITCTLHQLRHSHTTEFINGGVSLLAIRKRLGHKNLQTTLRYVEEADEVADIEVRRWRRRRFSL